MTAPPKEKKQGVEKHIRDHTESSLLGYLIGISKPELLIFSPHLHLAQPSPCLKPSLHQLLRSSSGGALIPPSLIRHVQSISKWSEFDHFQHFHCYRPGVRLTSISTGLDSGSALTAGVPPQTHQTPLSLTSPPDT